MVVLVIYVVRMFDLKCSQKCSQKQKKFHLYEEKDYSREDYYVMCNVHPNLCVHQHFFMCVYVCLYVWQYVCIHVCVCIHNCMSVCPFYDLSMLFCLLC